MLLSVEESKIRGAHFTVSFLSLSATTCVITVSYSKLGNMRTFVSSSCFEGDSIDWTQSRKMSVKCDVIKNDRRFLMSATVVFCFLLCLFSDGDFRVTDTVPILFMVFYYEDHIAIKR